MKRILISVAVALAVSAAVTIANEVPLPEVTGVMGLDSATENAWLAVRTIVPENYAISGVMWYNNDGTQVFPEVLVGTGQAGGPGAVEDMMVVATNVMGLSSNWSELVFTEPVAASLSALYVVWRFPNAEYSEPGEDGGPALGYVTGDEGSKGWITGNGETWARLHGDYRFGVIPQFVPFQDGMAVKSLDGDQEEEIPVLRPYVHAGPNPFNPRIVFRFGLPRKGHVEIDVYDLRGARVAKVVNEVFDAGHHAVAWEGRDGAGRRVASGVYFAKVKTPDLAKTVRIALIK